MKVLIPEDIKIALDVKDRRILSAYAENVRLPLSQIAKKVGLSRQSVEYRVSQFEKNKLVVGSRAVINLKKLGFQTYHFFIQTKNPKEEEVIIKKCEQSDFVNAIITYTGHWPLEISIVAKDPSDFSAKLESLFQNQSVGVENILIILETLKSVVLPKSFLSATKELQKKSDTKEDLSLDSKDYLLLELLAENAQYKIPILAQKLSLSSDAISYRIKKLYSSNIIVQFRPVINYAALNLDIHTVLIRTAQNDVSQKRFEMFIKQDARVIWVAKTVGSWNYMIFILSSRPEELHQFVQESKNQFADFIQQYETLYAYKEYKYSYYSRAINLIPVRNRC